MPEGQNAASTYLEQERQKWRRFELLTEDPAQVAEFQAVVDRHHLTRRELAVITATLRVRSEFALANFDT